MNSLTVSITKDIIARSYRCGTENEIDIIGNHCPIALALLERFPDVFVSGTHVHAFGDESDLAFPLPVKRLNSFTALTPLPIHRKKEWVCRNFRLKLYWRKLAN